MRLRSDLDIEAYVQLKNKETKEFSLRYSEKLFREFILKYSIVKAKASKGRYFAHKKVGTPPRVDHSEYFAGSDGTIFFVYHPYCNINCVGEDKEALIRELILKYDHLDIGYEVFDPSVDWYFPGATFLVVLTTKKTFFSS
jgi:hypothetical protein